MAIKLLVLSLCTSGFFYQAWTFLQMYLVYPTNLDISEEYPDSFLEPAITICHRNRVSCGLDYGRLENPSSCTSDRVGEYIIIGLHTNLRFLVSQVLQNLELLEATYNIRIFFNTRTAMRGHFDSYQIINRQPYCKLFPEKCSWQYSAWESFCDRYRRMCPNPKPPDFNFGIPLFIPIDDLNASNAFLNDLGAQEDSNLKNFCFRLGFVDNRPCNASPAVIQVSKAGLPYRCYSLFSLLLKPYEETSNVTMAEGYAFQMDMHPEEHFNTIHSVQASVVFHDPRKSVNPFTEGITLTAGKWYQLFPTMERKESLPSPYASNCVDYLKEWKKNGGIGPLSKDDCIDLCKINAMVTEYGCVGKSMTYPNKFPICETLEISASSDDSRKCASTCRDACEENIFHVTSETKLDLQGLCNEEDEYCKSRWLTIQVSFARMKVKKFKQIPRIESIELFSYIGGFLGMWLGISLASVFDLAEMIYDVIGYVFLKRKRNKKSITPVEHYGDHTTIKK